MIAIALQTWFFWHMFTSYETVSKAFFELADHAVAVRATELTLTFWKVLRPHAIIDRTVGIYLLALAIFDVANPLTNIFHTCFRTYVNISKLTNYAIVSTPRSHLVLAVPV